MDSLTQRVLAEGFNQFLSQESRQVNHGQKDGKVLFRHLLFGIVRIGTEVDDLLRVPLMTIPRETFVFQVDQRQRLSPRSIAKPLKKIVEHLLIFAIWQCCPRLRTGYARVLKFLTGLRNPSVQGASLFITQGSGTEMRLQSRIGTSSFLQRLIAMCLACGSVSD